MSNQPVTMHSWSLLTELNGLGEAVFTTTVTSHDKGAERAVLMLALNPHNLDIVRASLLRPGANRRSINPDDVPNTIADLARTVTAEQFHRT